ncbi:uncharacterized protein LOC121377438 isoform X2 [Gigantopelta aegis]|uniref:uncharacterized protein LOC121377438 isoform X2 n=1 Tax=Gigantopelta aegis TaxID=1735272 RepID=UPI001B889D44|nr:uncharacterized protein LOC121377438 isoform X2 [Gigantopelta aegis]
MTQLSPTWTKKRIPQEELDAYLNGNPTSTSGPQHFLYKPNHDDSLGKNQTTSSRSVVQNARNRKLRKLAVAARNNFSKSMDVNSKISISERLPMGPDIRFREYKSYTPYKPNPAFSVDPFKKYISSDSKRNANGYLSGEYREYGSDRKRPVVVKQKTVSKPQKTVSKPQKTKSKPNKQVPEKIIPKPEKPKSKAVKQVPEKNVTISDEIKPKENYHNLEKMIKPEKKTVQIKTVDDEFVVKQYFNAPRAATVTAAAQAWRRMYEVKDH